MKKLFNQFKAAMDQAANPHAPSSISDHPIAAGASWSPLRPGGSSFKTHKFKLIDAHSAVFGSTIGARLFALAFGGMGTIIAIIGITGLMSDGPQGLSVGLIMAVIGTLFAGVGVWLYLTFDKAIIFNLSEGLFWRGKRPNLSDSTQKPDDWCRISEIAGIQMLKELSRSNKNTFYSYEINLILDDSSRRHVVDHGNKDQILQDAFQLGEFLQVPVWNGIDQ